MKLTSLAVVVMTTLMASLIVNVDAQTKPQKRVPDVQSSTLALEAKLRLEADDVRPVTQTMFYLLDDSLPKILRDAGVKLPRDISPSDASYVHEFGLNSEYTTSREGIQFIDNAMAALKPHIIQSIKTDSSGKAKFSPVPVGTYYVVGTAHISMVCCFVVWNLKIELKSPQSSVTLSRDNAAYALISR
jgi:hypothetical protein